jgi:hypothetical protein
MTTAEWILNCTLLGWVLTRNLGTRPVNRGRYVLPLVLVAVFAGIYLRHIPGRGNDHQLELAGVGAGLVFGLLASAATRTGRDAAGQLVVRAGALFAAVWVVAIGGRIAFAELATHAWGPAIARFSIAHQITGADAWRTAFVLMALTMVLTRTAAGLLVAARHRRPAVLTGEPRVPSVA